MFSVAALIGIAKGLFSEYCDKGNIKSNRSQLKEVLAPKCGDMQEQFCGVPELRHRASACLHAGTVLT